MSSFEELLAKREAEKAVGPESAKVQVVFGGELITLKFTEMSGMEWAAITAKNPPRLDAFVDRRYAYNVHAVCGEAAPVCGVYVDGEGEVRWTAEQWALMLSELSGPDFGSICDIIFTLNQWNPEQRTEKLKKALIAGSTVKQNSLENSASVSSVSTGGNRRTRRSTSTKKAVSPGQ